MKLTLGMKVNGSTVAVNHEDVVRFAEHVGKSVESVAVLLKGASDDAIKQFLDWKKGG